MTAGGSVGCYLWLARSGSALPPGTLHVGVRNYAELVLFGSRGCKRLREMTTASLHAAVAWSQREVQARTLRSLPQMSIKAEVYP